MNNKQNNVNRDLLDKQRASDAQSYGGFRAKTNEQYDQASKNATDQRASVQGSYNGTEPNNTFLPSGLVPNSQGWFDLPAGMGGGPGGGYANSDYSEAKAGYRGFADNGGVNRGDFSPALSSYQGFMQNGGLSEGDVNNMRYRATSQIPSFYQGYKNALARRSNVQGGYAPGYDAQMQQIGRDASGAGYDASRKAEADIADRVQQGREFGTAGYGNLMSDITGKEQAGKEFGVSGLKGIGDSELGQSEFNASLGDSRAARAQQMQQFLLDAYQKGGMFSATGKANLYTQDRADVNNALQLWLQSINGQAGNANANLATRSGIKDASWLASMGGFGGGLGTLGSVLSLFGKKESDAANNEVKTSPDSPNGPMPSGGF